MRSRTLTSLFTIMYASCLLHLYLNMCNHCNVVFTYMVIYSLSSAASECNIDNGGCDHYCTETIQNYTCSCYPGYTLQSNGYTCTGKIVQALFFVVYSFQLLIFAFFNQIWTVVPLMAMFVL